jgi:DNA-binding NarL/FixJ family response regulator
LIVDDQDMMVTAIRALLETSEEIEVVGSAWNGEEALLRVAELSPDVALVDIDMPVMDGVEMTQHVTERFPETRVLILSGLYAPERVDQALRNGADSYLPKDRISDDLIDRVLAVERPSTAGSR